MFYLWLRWNIDDMGWFFDLKLSEPTLECHSYCIEQIYIETL